MTNLKRRLVLQILPLMILLICLPSFVKSEELEFPKETILRRSEGLYYNADALEPWYACFSGQDTVKLGLIYSQYLNKYDLVLDLQKERKLLNAENLNLSSQIESIDLQLNVALATLAVVQRDREMGYQLYQEEVKKNKKLVKKYKFKIILFGAGAGIIGAAAGILIGIFAI